MQCAAIWATSLVAWDHRAHVPVLDPEVFVNSFNGVYLDILGLNWRECTLVLESRSNWYRGLVELRRRRECKVGIKMEGQGSDR